jgi:mono/diheme cytochrome c family protein
MWVSANEEDWKKFKQPIMNVLDAKTGGTKALRIGYLFIIPILIGGFSYNAMVPKSEEPIELRTVHPAPPASTKVHGKTYTLQTSQNPYRVNPEGKYDQEYSNANIVEQGMGRLMKPNANPWDKDAQGYLKYVREGGEIFYQNCHFCHGDNLNGRGLHAIQSPQTLLTQVRSRNYKKHSSSGVYPRVGSACQMKGFPGPL